MAATAGCRRRFVQPQHAALAKGLDRVLAVAVKDDARYRRSRMSIIDDDCSIDDHGSKEQDCDTNCRDFHGNEA